jgi:glutamyl-tRNA synthetase
MPPVVRFAPSPTGRIHIGNVRTAALNWLFAKKAGGTFLLRLDDTDRERSREEFAEAIRQDLAWLGLVWSREERQSARSARYAEVAEALKAAGRLYACYETEDELDRRRKRQMALGRPPIYDRASLRLTAAERSKLEAEGRKPHWRFRLANAGPGGGAAGALDPEPTLVTWRDLVRGDQSVDVGSLSDPVLVRADGTVLYTFSSVIDDIDFGVTHVIRGEDHVTNTGVQIQLFEAMGAAPPAFAHHSLLIGADGHALSKRLGALSVAGLRDAGLEPIAVVCHAALIGTSDAVAPYPSLAALADRFGFEKLSRAPGRFDIAELEALNGRCLHETDYPAVEARLASLGVGGGAAFWTAVRGNLVRLSDARSWWQVVSGEIVPQIEDAAFCRTAGELLPAEPWDSATWGTWTAAVKASTGRSGRALFHPLRLALTGQAAGPELKALLPLIGRERARMRLSGATG